MYEFKIRSKTWPYLIQNDQKLIMYKNYLQKEILRKGTCRQHECKFLPQWLSVFTVLF